MSVAETGARRGPRPPQCLSLRSTSPIPSSLRKIQASLQSPVTLYLKIASSHATEVGNANLSIDDYLYLNPSVFVENAFLKYSRPLTRLSITVFSLSSAAGTLPQ